MYDGYLSTFLFKELGKKLGMSFDDFLNRPKFEIESIIRVVDETDKKKDNINKTVLKELEDSAPKPKPSDIT